MRYTYLFLAFAALLWTSNAFAQLPSDGESSLSLAEARKLLGDRSPPVRLRAALALTTHRDAQGIEALIDLLEELPVNDRRQAEQALREVAGEWSPNPPLPGEDELSRKIRREVWAGWWRTIDGPTLLAAFQKRTSSKEKQNDARGKLPLAAPGLLAARKPVGASAALLAYLPDADDRLMKDEIIKALKSLLLTTDKVDPAVLQALGDALPVRRIVAAEALVGAGGAKHWESVRPLLKDADAEVRLRVASALVNSQDREAVPALIALLSELPRDQVSEAEELLQRLAGSKAPGVPWVSDDAPARKRLGDAWQAWWKEHGAKVDLAELAKTRGSSGLTLVALGDGKRAGFGAAAAAQPGKVVAIDRSGQVRWEIDNLDHPIDIQLLPGQRLLVAEYYGKRVTERDFKGKILWEVNLPASPVNVQRLANGNTFIALYGSTAKAKANGQALIEVDPTGKTVASFAVPVGIAGAPAVAMGLARDMLFAAQKMPDGKMICLTYDQNCVWMDGAGKEIKRIAVPQTKGSTPLNTMGNIDVTFKGHVLFAHTGGTVSEYDSDGKIVWQVKVSGHRATRLANGNTLVALTSGGVVELDAAGRTVWQYEPPGGLQAIRAR